MKGYEVRYEKILKNTSCSDYDTRNNCFGSIRLVFHNIYSS